MIIKDLIPVYLKNLNTLGRSPRTVKGAGYDLRTFLRFLDEERVYELDDLTADIMEAYQEDLAFRLTTKGKLLTIRSQTQLLGAARGFTRFLKEKDYLLHDPGEGIKLPRKPKTLPKVILTIEEIKKLINAHDRHTNKGYRNMIILEILYDTAIRRDELSSIKIHDLDLNSGYVLIRGKGNKERVVPLSNRVSELIRSYVLAVRPAFIINDKDPAYLILNRWGERMDGNSIWCVVKESARLAKIKKNVTTHTLRHTCATHMSRNGAPVRHIQEMLGHESLESTQIYTHVTINELKKIHAKYHPSENLKE